MILVVDEVAARARRLAEMQSAQHAREQEAHEAWHALAARARALGRPVPDPAIAAYDALIDARSRAVEAVDAALEALEDTLSDWRRRLEQTEGESRALDALRARLRRTLADEVGELGPGELERVVARALGDRRETGPLRAPSRPDGPPSAGVAQEAQLLSHLLDADDDPADDLARPTDRPTAAPQPTPPGPLRALRPTAESAARLRPVPARASSPDTGTIESASIDDYDDRAVLDAFAAFDEAAEALSGPGGAEPEDLDDLGSLADLGTSGSGGPDEALARWLGAPAAAPAPPPEESGEAAIDADIEPLDDPDSLLEWEAAGLGHDVALLVERRRPPSARTSVIEVVDDPFAAFDDFDDSLDAPFGFVDNVTSGQLPALPDADWRFDDAADDNDPSDNDPSDDDPSDADPSDAPSAPGDDPGPMLEDPFAESVNDGPDPGGSTHPGGALDEPSPSDSFIDRVDFGQAFPAIRAPLAADSIEAAPPDPPADFDAAFGAAFADDAPGERSLDSLDLELDAAFADAHAPGPARVRDPRLAAAFDPRGPRPPASASASGDDSLPDHPLDAAPGGSLLPAPSEPGATGWGPERPAGSGDAATDPGARPHDPELDRLDAELDLAFAEAAGPGLLPFDAPVLTQPTAAPSMPTVAAEPLDASTDPSSGAAEASEPAPALGFGLDAALADAEPRDADADFSEADFADGGNLTGLDWPPARPLDAFPDGSVDLPEQGPAARADDPWRSSPIAPRPAPSATLADALQAARTGHPDRRRAPAPARPEVEEHHRITDRFATLAAGLDDDPWAALDIPDHSGETGPVELLPALVRSRRQGHPERSDERPRIAGPAPAPAPIDDESAPRAPLGVRVGLEAGDRFFTGFSRDISVDGIFVDTRHRLPRGQVVEVFFELPGGRSINAEGVVRRVKVNDSGQPTGLGIRFGRLTREARVQIGRYVARTLTGKIPLP